MPDVQHALDLIEQGRHAEAAPLLEEVTQRFPAYVFAHVVLARVYEAQERWDDALATWRDARFLMSSSPAIEDGLERTLRAMLALGVAPAAEIAAEEVPVDRGDATEEAPADMTEEATEQVNTLLGQADEIDEGAETEAVPEATSFFPEGAVPPEEPPPDALFSQPTAPPVDAVDDLVEPAEVPVEEATPEADDVDDEAAVTAEEDAPPVSEEAEADEADIDEAEYLEIERLIDERLRAEGIDADEGIVPPEDDAASDEEADRDDPDASPTAASDAPSDVSRGELLSSEVDDLDALIHQLESARIQPHHDLDDLPEPKLDNEIEDMVSETLARIYAAQSKYEEAARVYEQLAIQQPDRSITFLQKAAEMRSRATEDDS
jgi:tetratricopeptide (TPR) repeat protein